MFFNELTRDFRDLTPNSLEAKIRSTVECTLPALSFIIEYCRGYSVVAKKELTSVIKVTLISQFKWNKVDVFGFQPSLDHALSLFPIYVKYSEVYNLFSKFFISVLKNLQSQIGTEFTKNAMHIFFQVALKWVDLIWGVWIFI